MRILELITLGEIGGAQNVLVDLLKGFTERGYEAEIDVVFGEGEYLSQALSPWFRGRIIQMPWMGRSINPLKDLRTLLELKSLCDTRKYDLVHCHSSKASWLGRIAASWAGVPRICMTVHGLSFYAGSSRTTGFIYKTVEKLAVPLATDYVFVSPKDMSEMQALGMRDDKCKIIPNGRPMPPRPLVGLRDLLAVPADVPLVYKVARLSEIKNPLLFLRIANNVIQQYPAGHQLPVFVLVGDGPLEAECKATITREGIGSNVHILGHKKEAGQYFWDADLAVLTSNYEACPLVAIEAMATGTPVVASDVGGTGAVVRHGETGYLFAPGNVEVAAKHITDLLLNHKLRTEMGGNALKLYQEEYTVERMVDEYARHFGLQEV